MKPFRMPSTAQFNPITNRHAVRPLLLFVLMSLLLSSTVVYPVAAQGDPPTALKPLPVLPKPAKTTIGTGVQPDLVVLKFQEGTHIRLRGTHLSFEEAALSLDEEQRAKRRNLDRNTVKRQLADLNRMLTQDARLHVERLFTRPENDLDKEKQEGERAIHEELADLNLFYYVRIKDATPDGTAQLIDHLNALNIVEIAYAEPVIELAADIAPATPNYAANQGYLDAAPTGIDARYAWTFPGGRGEQVRIGDVERNWRLDHEDLPGNIWRGGTLANAFPDDIEHGTAVLGELVGLDDGHGVTGIVPAIGVGVSSSFGRSFADAINDAAANAGRGNIILVEGQIQGPATTPPCPTNPCTNDQWGLVPVEFDNSAFRAIQTAMANGVIVVEAAGNGSMNLDSAIYNRAFDRTFQDSRAILVGAGTSTTQAPHTWSNAGSRVDVQGWGDSVMTLGYGNIRVNGTDARQWYTRSFGGTSSASPIVAGAAASINGIRVARGLPRLNSIEMRQLLRSTGTPQASSTRQIGPLPNLRRAVDQALKVSLRSFNHPTYYFRHRDYLGQLTTISTDPDKQDATFRVVPGLADPAAISFESVNFPGYYLRHQGFALKLQPYANDDLFRKDATFRVRLGLASSTRSSFESINFPGYYLRHKDFKLYLQQGSDDLFKKDATFEVVAPWWR